MPPSSLLLLKLPLPSLLLLVLHLLKLHLPELLMLLVRSSNEDDMEMTQILHTQTKTIKTQGSFSRC